MAPEVAAAGIALTGGVISVAVSWIVARTTAATELRKQQLDLFKSYAEGLQEKRLDVYPAASVLLSNCIKDVHRGTLTHERLTDMLTKIPRVGLGSLGAS